MSKHQFIKEKLDMLADILADNIWAAEDADERADLFEGALDSLVKRMRWWRAKQLSPAPEGDAE